MGGLWYELENAKKGFTEEFMIGSCLQRQIEAHLEEKKRRILRVCTWIRIQSQEMSSIFLANY